MSWTLVIAYLLAPTTGMYCHFLFGQYKAAEHMGMASFWAAASGLAVGLLLRLLFIRADHVVLYGTYACIAALVFNYFGVPW